MNLPSFFHQSRHLEKSCIERQIVTNSVHLRFSRDRAKDQICVSLVFCFVFVLAWKTGIKSRQLTTRGKEIGAQRGCQEVEKSNVTLKE